MTFDAIGLAAIIALAIIAFLAGLSLFKDDVDNLTEDQ